MQLIEVKPGRPSTGARVVLRREDLRGGKWVDSGVIRVLEPGVVFETYLSENSRFILEEHRA